MNEKFTWGEIWGHHPLGRKPVQCPVLTTYSGVIFCRCPEFSWKWLVATDIKHHYFSLVNQFFRLCGRFFSSVFAL